MHNVHFGSQKVNIQFIVWIHQAGSDITQGPLKVPIVVCPLSAGPKILTEDQTFGERCTGLACKHRYHHPHTLILRHQRHSKARTDIEARIIIPRNKHVKRLETNSKARIVKPRDTLPRTQKQRQTKAWVHGENGEKGRDQTICGTTQTYLMQ